MSIKNFCQQFHLLDKSQICSFLLRNEMKVRDTVSRNNLKIDKPQCKNGSHQQKVNCWKCIFCEPRHQPGRLQFIHTEHRWIIDNRSNIYRKFFTNNEANLFSQKRNKAFCLLKNNSVARLQVHWTRNSAIEQSDGRCWQNKWRIWFSVNSDRSWISLKIDSKCSLSFVRFFNLQMMTSWDMKNTSG